MTGVGSRIRSAALTVSALRTLVLVAGLTITLGATLVRFTALDSQPGGLYPDEGAEGWDAHRLLHQPGFHPVFFEDDAGREALYGYIVAAMFRLFGESVITLRATSALLGVFGVVAVFFAIRRFGRAAALGAMAWAAGSLWLICISRDGMRNVLVPLFGALAVWSLLAWADRHTRRSALIAGAVLGAGLWTYQPLKLLPLLLVTWLWWVRRVDPDRFRDLRPDLPALALAYLVVAAPMLLTAVLNPVGYFGRAVGVSVLNPQNGSIGLVEHTLRTLGMFVLGGDPNPRHNVAGLPLLGWPHFALACAGGWRAWQNRRHSGHALLLIGVPVFLIPPLLGIDGTAPHFLRSLGLAPFLAGLIGLGVIEVVDLAARAASTVHPGSDPQRATATRGWAAGLVAVVSALGLVALGAGSAAAYFSRPVSARYEAYSFNVVELARQAGPRTLALIDDYQATDLRFIDSNAPPLIAEPGTKVARIADYDRVLALTRAAIVASVGEDAAASASAVATNPQGRPSVWELRPRR